MLRQLAAPHLRGQGGGEDAGQPVEQGHAKNAQPVRRGEHAGVAAEPAQRPRGLVVHNARAPGRGPAPGWNSVGAQWSMRGVPVMPSVGSWYSKRSLTSCPHGVFVTCSASAMMVLNPAQEYAKRVPGAASSSVASRSVKQRLALKSAPLRQRRVPAPPLGRQPRGVREQMPQRDGCLRPVRVGGQPPANGRIQRQHAAVHQDQRRDSGEQLGHRGQVKERARSGGAGREHGQLRCRPSRPRRSPRRVPRRPRRPHPAGLAGCGAYLLRGSGEVRSWVGPPSCVASGMPASMAAGRKPSFSRQELNGLARPGGPS